MKKSINLILLATLLIFAAPSMTKAEESPEAEELPKAEKPVIQKALSAIFDISVVPEDGQDAEQQSQSEMECFNFATSETDLDIFSLQKQMEAEKSVEKKQSIAEQVVVFKKVFATCLEGKNYTVRY